MAKFHINPSSGEPGVCKAELSCPFGDLKAEHYANAEDARSAAEQIYAGFDQGEEATWQDAEGYKNMYRSWLLETEHSEQKPLQAGKIARWMLNDGEAGQFMLESTTEAKTQLLLNPTIFLEADEDGDEDNYYDDTLPTPEWCPNVDLVFNTEAGEVDYTLLIGDKVAAVSDSEKVVKGQDLHDFMANAVAYSYASLMAGNYDDRLKGK